MIGEENDFRIWLRITLALTLSHVVCEPWLQKDLPPSV